MPDDKAVGKKLADDAMYKLEHQSTDRGKSKDFAPRLVGISDIQVAYVPILFFKEEETAIDKPGITKAWFNCKLSLQKIIY